MPESEAWRKQLHFYNTVTPGFEVKTDKINLKETLAKRSVFVRSILKENNLAQKFSVTKTPASPINCSVLPSALTELVSCFYSATQMQVFTVDSHSLVR